MTKFSQLWETHDVEAGQTLEVCLGPLRLWMHRGQQDWHVAHESDPGCDDRCSIRMTDDPFDLTRKWTRWILDPKIDQIRFHPQLPDRPILVRPEMPMCLMPKQSIRFFIGIPGWLSITFGTRQEQEIEVPSITLSNSWFGSTTGGELCYALKTTAKLHQHELAPGAHRIIFPLEVKNLSAEKLNFERLCVRPQFLSVFQGDTRLWTSKGRVSYRGEENWSRIVHASGPPEFDAAGLKVGTAREVMKRGTLLRTFDSLKKKVEVE